MTGEAIIISAQAFNTGGATSFNTRPPDFNTGAPGFNTEAPDFNTGAPIITSEAAAVKPARNQDYYR